MSAEALRKPIEFTEDNQWDENPERRKVFWLGTAGIELNTVLARSRADATALPERSQDILHGRSDYVSQRHVIARSVLPVYQDRVELLFDQIGDIYHEKGFRFQSALLTPNEHVRVGSSGYGQYGDIDPDVPIPLLQRRLIESGRKDFDPHSNIATILTIGEVDRARRLYGMPIIDIAIGRVTDQVDEVAAADSYFFLSPERREQVIRQEQEILEELRAVSSSMLADYERSGSLLDHLGDYMDGKITSPQIRTYHEALVVPSLDLSNAIREAKQLAFATGRWDHILTPQEILLRVAGRVDERYLARPYTPLGIQDGEDPKVIATLRQGEQSMIINTHIADYEMPFGFRLEELNVDSNTIESPTFVDRHDGSTEDEEGVKAVYANKLSFPFARPEDWYSERPTEET